MHPQVKLQTANSRILGRSERSGKPKAQARGWAAAYLGRRTLNRRQADESGPFVLFPNPLLALQASYYREWGVEANHVSVSNGAGASGGGTNLKTSRIQRVPIDRLSSPKPVDPTVP